MNPVIAALIALEPKDIPALGMLEELTNNPPFLDQLAGMSDELEQACGELERLASDSQRIAERCLTLQPQSLQPSQQAPVGF
jgi:hypothetical protein